MKKRQNKLDWSLPALGKGGRFEGGKKEHSACIPPLGRKVYVAEQ